MAFPTSPSVGDSYTAPSGVVYQYTSIGTWNIRQGQDDFASLSSTQKTNILTAIKTIDGSSSGLDADLLDGQEGSYYADIAARLGYTPYDAAKLPTGSLMMFGATTAPTGWLRCNGRTVGDASSSATERANADTSALFIFLWTNYGDAVCAVSGGRGASAAADFAAHKTIALPDMRGRSPFGLDDMGNSAASRLGSVISGQTTNGSSGGSETVTLAASHIPAHTHGFSGTTSSNGAHTHTPLGGGNFQVSTASGGGIAGGGTNNSTPVATTSSDGAHTHTYSGTTDNGTGGGTAHSNMPPAFLTTFIIKL